MGIEGVGGIGNSLSLSMVVFADVTEFVSAGGMLNCDQERC